MKPKNRVSKGRGEFNKYMLEPGAINFISFSPEVHLWQAESIAEVFPKLGPWPCSRTLSLHSLPLSPADFQPSLGGCAYRRNNLTGDLDKTPFLTQRADNFKGTLLPPLHRRNLPQRTSLHGTAVVSEGGRGCQPEAEILHGSSVNVAKNWRENMKRRWTCSALNMFILTSLKPLKNHWAKLQGINQSEREKEKGQAKQSHYFDWQWKITQDP